MSAPIVRIAKKYPVLFWMWVAGSVIAFFVCEEKIEAVLGAFVVMMVLWFIENPKEALQAIANSGSKSSSSGNSAANEYVAPQVHTNTPEERQIAYAVQKGTYAYAYDAKNNLLFTRYGQLEGWTSSSITVYTENNHSMTTYDAKNNFVGVQVVYK